MVIGFLVIWLPYACVSLLETVGELSYFLHHMIIWTNIIGNLDKYN